MSQWLDAASQSSSIAEACGKMEPPVTITEYLKARAADPEFDAACLVFDQVIELRIIENIRLASENGDARAQALYFRDARRPSFLPGFASWHAAPSPPPTPAVNSFSAEVAAAMIEAGLNEYEAQIRADAEKSKSPAPKKPRRTAATKVRPAADAKP